MRNSFPDRKTKQGFTLLEVMIALAILALVGVAFLRAQASSVRLVNESVQISLATLLAKEKMAELEGDQTLETGKKSGTAEEAWMTFRWEQRVTPAEIPRLRKLQVAVSWMEGEAERKVEFTRYLGPKT
jgi:general secretion pathway protein I